MKGALKNPDKVDKQENRKRILRALKRPKTANEVIEVLFKSDVITGMIKKRTWKYYVHLNKLFAPMEKDGLIMEVGTKLGPTNRVEKIWQKM